MTEEFLCALQGVWNVFIYFERTFWFIFVSNKKTNNPTDNSNNNNNDSTQLPVCCFWCGLLRRSFPLYVLCAEMSSNVHQTFLWPLPPDVASSHVTFYLQSFWQEVWPERPRSASCQSSTTVTHDVGNWSWARLLSSSSAHLFNPPFIYLFNSEDKKKHEDGCDQTLKG